MKISIKDTAHKTAPPETEMKLYLDVRRDVVFLMGEDANGQSWEIIGFYPNETPKLIPYIAESSGWPLDDNGALIIRH